MKKCVLVLMVLAAACATKAFGDQSVGTVSFKLDNQTSSQPTLYNAQTQETVYLGPYAYDFSDASSGVPFAGESNPIDGFCVDYVTNIGINTAPYPATVYQLDNTGGWGSIPPSSANIANLNAVDARVVQIVGYYS